MLTLVETPVFTRRVADLWTEEALREFQGYLVQHPEAGDVIRASGGLRKIRWGREGQGKRDGVRVIYYIATSEGVIYLLMIYAKAEKDTLSAKEVEILRKIVEV